MADLNAPRPGIGGKAANLEILAALPHVTVPPFRVLDESWFRRCVGPLAEREGVSAALREKVLALDPGAEFRAHLAAELAALRAAGAGPFLSVRSSALGEDAAEASFAGQFDTVLNVPASDAEAAARAVLRCWASVYGERVLAYRAKMGLPPPTMAVVLQSMIAGEVSGVCFTVNPVTGDTGELLVSATWGLGEGIVSGRYEGDQFSLAREADFYVERIASKPARLAALADGGVEEAPVEADAQDRPCLSPADLDALKRAALAIEAHYRQPLDLEFTLRAGRLYILQARPVTAAGPAERARWGRKILWDNSNIVESYNGLTSPLTFSFIAAAYQEVYEQFGRMLGIRRRVHEENQLLMRNYLGLIRGRVYYNLLTWYASLRQLPFFRYTAGAMEAMMGVRQGMEIKRLGAAPGGGTGRWRVLRGMRGVREKTRVTVFTLWNALRAASRIRRFQRDFAARYAGFAALPWDRQPPDRLMALYEEMTLVFLKRWQAPILADTLAMVFYKGLASLCEKWVGPGAAGLQNDLLAGRGQVESTEPTRKILECFREIRDDNHLSALFRGTPADRVLEALRASPEPGARKFLAWLDGYLGLYGSRSMNELKLEVPTLEEDPAFLFATLKNYFAAPDLALAVLDRSAGDLRAQAEAKVSEAFRGRPLRRLLFAWVLRGAVRNIRNREAMRLARSRVYGLVRKLALSYGATLAAAGLLESRDDVFFLSLQELQAYAEGRSLTLDLRGVVALRKKEYAAFAAEEEPAERFHTIGLPYHRQSYAPEGGGSNLDGILQGISCCPGKRIGSVRVIRAPEDDLRLSGEILAAPRTDPGWIPLYPSISALLIEKGSVLSHSAIVAREMGIPTIVGIENLTRRLKDGDRVEVDAGAGTVRILEGKA